MRVRKVSKKILSGMLAMTMVLSSVMTASAQYGDNTGSQGDFDSGDATAGKVSYLDDNQGSWRITLGSRNLIKDGTTDTTKITTNLINNRDMSIVVTSGSISGPIYESTSTSTIDLKEATAVEKLSEVFPQMPGSDTIFDNYASNGSYNPGKYNDYLGAGGPFETYIGENFEEAIASFCSAVGADISKVDISDSLFIIEPLLVVYSGNIKKYTVLGFQDYVAGTPNGELNSFYNTVTFDSTIDSAYTTQAQVNSTIETIQATQGETVYTFTDTKGVLGEAGATISSSKNTAGSGFGIYGATVQTGVPLQTSAAYTVFYEGNSAETNKGSTVVGSTNGVLEANKETLNYTYSATASSKAGEAVLSTYGTTIKTPLNEKKSGTGILEDLTGYKAWEGKEQTHINVAAGVQKINYVTTDTATLNTVASAVQTVIPNYTSAGGNSKLTSQASLVNGGTVNVGNYYTVVYRAANQTLSSATDYVSAISTSLAGETEILENKASNISTEYTALKYNGSMSNIATNFALKAVDSVKPVTVNDSNGIQTDGGELGVSVTIMAEAKPVTSYIAYAEYNLGTGGIDCVDKDNITYDVSKDGTFTINNSGEKTTMYAIVPNTSKYSLKVESCGLKAYSNLSGGHDMTPSMLVEGIELAGGDVVSSGYISKGNTVKVGTPDGEEGYSVFVVEIVNDNTPEEPGYPVETNELHVEDYEINYIYPSMLETTQSYGSLKDLATYIQVGTEVLGAGCNEVSSVKYESSSEKKISGTSNYAGNVINKNKGLGTNKNILQYDAVTGGNFTTEASAREGYVFTSNYTNVKFSLAMNLVRTAFGDKVVVSTMSDQTLDSSYATTNLDLTYGNVPNTAANATSKRTSTATVGTTLKDVFEWNTYFNLTGSQYVSNIGGYTKDECQEFENRCVPVNYTKLTVDTKNPASFDGTRVRYEISEKAYKYQTETLAKGENEKADNPVTGTVVGQVSGLTSTSSTIANEYKAAGVKSSTATLSFYPEVVMRAYSSTGDKITTSIVSGDDRGAIASVLTHEVKVMGEVKRQVVPSSMYAIRLEQTNATAIEGEVKSDTFAVGTEVSGVSGGLPTLYAGGDMSLVTTPNVELNFYGYALDIAETTDSLEGTGTYSTVVKNGAAVKTIWGNGTSYEPEKEYNTWVKEVLGSLNADVTLKVTGSGVNKTFNNFATSVKDIKVADKTVADTVYNVEVKEGAIQTNKLGYIELIKAIQSDYDLGTYAKAEEMFENSGIYQTIIEAVEDSEDSFNKSQKSSAIGNGRENWYDEETRVFVVRRYAHENVTVGDILLNDKLDYNAAPTQSASATNQTNLQSATGKWYFTLYFDATPGGMGTLPVYNPANTGTLTTAATSGTVLINQVYVKDADFTVPSSSTNDMGNQ